MISVCMATYNGACFINQQLDSILTQLSTDDEIIISDDNSTDNTVELIQSYNDKRIKLFFNPNKLTYICCDVYTYLHYNPTLLFKKKFSNP